MSENRKTSAKASLETLQAKLKTAQAIQFSIMCIFLIFILLWVVLGVWQDNLILFVSQIVMFVAISGALISSQGGLRSEVKRLEKESNN